MLNGAGLQDELRNKVWVECVMTTTYLSNIVATKSGDKCRYELTVGCKPKPNLIFKTFGDVGMVTTMDNIQGKLRNRGFTCMFAGYCWIH